MKIIKSSNFNHYLASTDTNISFIKASLAVVRRDLKEHLAQPLNCLEPIFFFSLIFLLFPLAVGFDNLDKLNEIAIGIAWVAVLLVTLLALGNLFKADYANGYLEQLALTPIALPWLLLLKIFVFWVVYCLPLVLVAPLWLALFTYQTDAYLMLLLTFLLGTPVLVLLGAIGSAITMNSNNSSLILSLLVAPLYIPTLILATSIVFYFQAGLPTNGLVACFVALLLFCITFAPFAISCAVRLGIE